MTDDELKSIVESYIVGLVECDAADSLYESEGLSGVDGETLNKAYTMWGRAKVSVVWNDDDTA